MARRSARNSRTTRTIPTAIAFTTSFTSPTPLCLAGRRSRGGCSGESARADRLLDEVEDGGRAAVIEEGVVALAFDYARRHHFLDGVATLDSQLLRTIKEMTSHLEVRQCSTGEWEDAVLQGFDVWRAVLAARGGRIAVDLDARSITFLGPSADQELPD